MIHAIPSSTRRAAGAVVVLGLGILLGSGFLTGIAAGSPGTTSVTNPSLAVSSSGAGATQVTYTIDFTATSALTHATSSVAVAAPAGTVFAAATGCGLQYRIIDVTTSQSDCAQDVTGAGTNEVSITLFTTDIAAGDAVQVMIRGIANPTSVGSGQLLLSTTSDPVPVPLPDDTTAAVAVGGASLKVSSPGAGATQVTYTIDFTATAGLTHGFSSVVVAAPVGTVFAAAAGCGNHYRIIDVTTSQSDCAQDVTGAGTNEVSITLFTTDIAAGDAVQVMIRGIANPTSVGSGQLLLSTTSNPVTVSFSDDTVPATAVGDFQFNASANGAGAPATWTSSFTATHGLTAGFSTITLTGPAGTVFAAPTGCNTAYRIVDVTTNQTDCAQDATGAGTNQVSVKLFTTNIAAGDQVTIEARHVTNPTTEGPAEVGLFTSSDPVPVSSSFSVGTSVTLSGQVTYLANTTVTPAQDAAVQACTIDGTTCSDALATTDSSGDYSLTVSKGATYVVTAFPPSGSALAPAKSAPAPVGSIDVAGVDVSLGTEVFVAPGITITSPDFGSQGAGTPNPRVFWSHPFQVSIDPSIAPSGDVVVATQLVVSGTDATTGRPAQKTVDIGGTVGGDPVGVTVGSEPISVTVPPLEPIHGDVTLSVRYKVYSAATGTGSAPPPGVVGPQVIDLIQPDNQEPTPTNPLAGYFLNRGAPGGVAVGGGTITGPDAANFAIVPLSQMGVPAGTNDCGSSPVTLEQYDGSVEPAQAAQCGVGVLFTPPPNATQILYYATLLEKAGNGIIPVQLVGCDSDLSAEAASVSGYDPCAQNVLPPEPDPDSPDPTSPGGPLYVDPSGTVLAASGSGSPAPIAGATVTIQRAETVAGPYVPVANGSALLSPSNRTNPDTTGPQGAFGWDVLAGHYQVVATAPGCNTVTSPALTVPPPVTGLDLTLTCTGPPAVTPTSTSLDATPNPVMLGQSVTLTATVSQASGTPAGVVAFADGTTVLGQAVIDPNSGRAQLQIPGLPVGVHQVTASYTGSAASAPSTSLQRALTVNAPTPTPPPPSGPTVTGLSPSSGPSYGWTLVVIHGTGFLPSSQSCTARGSWSWLWSWRRCLPVVHFGPKKATVLSAEATTVTVLAPSGTGSVDVTVTVDGATSATNAVDRYTYRRSVRTFPWSL